MCPSCLLPLHCGILQSIPGDFQGHCNECNLRREAWLRCHLINISVTAEPSAIFYEGGGGRSGEKHKPNGLLIAVSLPVLNNTLLLPSANELEKGKARC